MGIGSKIHHIAVHMDIAAVALITKGMSQISRVLYKSIASTGPNRLNRIRADSVEEVFDEASNVMRVFVIMVIMEQFFLSCC